MWLVFVGLCVAGVTPLSMFLNGYALGFVHGATMVFIVATIGLFFLLHTGSVRELSGVYGEDNTRDILRVAKRRRHVWGWIDNLEVQGGDIDHLVATPDGVFAVDSKWHGIDLTELVLRTDATAARRAARLASLILRSLRLQDLPVQPLVVVWGRGQHDLQGDPRVVDGVEIVGGLEFGNWLARHSAGDLTTQRAEQALAKLGEFKTRVDPSRRPQPGQKRDVTGGDR